MLIRKPFFLSHRDRNLASRHGKCQGSCLGPSVRLSVCQERGKTQYWGWGGGWGVKQPVRLQITGYADVWVSRQGDRNSKAKGIQEKGRASLQPAKMASSPKPHISASVQAGALPPRSPSPMPAVVGEGRSTHDFLRHSLHTLPHATAAACLSSAWRTLPGLPQSCLLPRLSITTRGSFQWGGLFSPILGPSLISLFASIMTITAVSKWQVYRCADLTLVSLPHLT